MPLAQKIDPQLLSLIPKEILEKFKIEYDSDNIHIKSWEHIDMSLSNSSHSNDQSGDDSGSNGSDGSGSSNDQNISSNSQAIGGYSRDNDGTHLIEDGSNEIGMER